MGKVTKLQAIVSDDLRRWYKWRSATTGLTLNAIVLAALSQYKESIGGEPPTIESSSSNSQSNWRQLLCE
jgi:hypothetical protein